MNYNFETLANLIVLLAQKIPNINVTKLLKMLYLIDEKAMVKYGVRVTWLDYSAWKNGPVLAELYNDLKYKKPTNLFQYIETKTTEKQTIILPKKKVDYDYFSEVEMTIINDIINEFQNKSASWLVKFLHNKGTQWHKVVSENNISFKDKKTSNYKIDLSNLIKNQPIQNTLYEAALESFEYEKSFNNAIF